MMNENEIEKGYGRGVFRLVCVPKNKAFFGEGLQLPLPILALMDSI